MSVDRCVSREKIRENKNLNIKLDVKSGEYRDFTASELNTLNQMLINSVKTFDGEV